MTFAERVAALTETRARHPEAVGEAAARRRRRPALLGPSGRLMIVAADHPARGALAAGDRPQAMADRTELLRRLCVALERPGVDGVLGTPDVIEDLLLLGALDEKVVIGSMNRGGLAGAAFEIDDRFTAYDPEAIAGQRLDGGKMLLRVEDDEPATAGALESCANAVTGLARRGLMAMVEPFVSRRVDGRVRNVLTADAVTRAVTIASGLGVTSARTWLKLPVVEEMDRVVAATTLPVLLLGGEVAADQVTTLASWQKALALPGVLGLVAGRTMLYPPGDDVAAAVDAALEVMR